MRISRHLAVLIGSVLTPLVAFAQQASPQAPDNPSILEDARTMTELMVCLRDKTPAECEGSRRYSALAREHGLGRLVLGTQSDGLVRTLGMTEGERNTLLIEAHKIYKGFKQQAQNDAERAVVTELGRQIHARLADVGLNQPLNAVLRGGYTLADAGDEFPTKLETGAPPLQSGALAFIDFESKHFGDDSAPFDFSFGGSFGLGPVLVVTSRRPDASEEAAGTDTGDSEPLVGNDAGGASGTFVPAMTTGLHWSLNARPSYKMPGQSELSFLLRFGQARVDQMTVKLGDGDDAALADIVRNGTGRWASFREAGVEFRIFEQSLDVVHHTKDTLLPLFAIGVGLRWDDRLKSNFDLDSFADGEQRYYARFSVNLAEVLDPRNTDTPGKSTFAAKISVEHHWRRRQSSEQPSGTRLMVEAAADILKLFNLGGKDKEPATTGTRATAAPDAKPNAGSLGHSPLSWEAPLQFRERLP